MPIKYYLLILLFVNTSYQQTSTIFDNNHKYFISKTSFTQAISFTNSNNSFNQHSTSILAKHFNYKLSNNSMLRSSAYLVNTNSLVQLNNNLQFKFTLGFEHNFSENTSIKILYSNFNNNASYFNPGFNY